MSQNISQALSQVLQVYRLVRRSLFDRIRAMHEVAKQERTSYQTIASACTRGIGIRHLDDLDDLLLAKNTNAFRKRLVQHFPGYQSVIENFFAEFKEGKEALAGDDPERTTRPLLPKEQRNLLNILLLKEIVNKLSTWKMRDDIPGGLKQEFQNLLDKIS